MNRYIKGCFCIILSAVMFGCMPLAAKIIYRDGINAMSLVLYRNLLAAPVLYLIMRRQGERVSVSQQQLRQVALLGIVGTALTPILLFLSYNYISSGAASTIHFVYPIFVLLGCALFFHERIDRVRVLCVALCSAGILLFYTPGEQAGFIGMALSFLSGVTYAFYIVYLAKSGLNELNPFKLSFCTAAACSVALLAFLLPTGLLTLPTTLASFGLCLLFALGITVGAVVLFQVGTSIIGPQRAAILSTFEPITGLIIGIVVFSEPFGLKTALGALFILTSVILLTLFDRKGTEQHTAAPDDATQLQ